MNAKIVKSAGRIFEILELFDQKKRPMPAVDIASSLGYPLASTHELLKTMTVLGYFTYGDPRWTYRPSSKLPQVVDWVRDTVSQNRRLSLFMEALNELTRETINLSRQLESEVKIIKGYECIHVIGVSAMPGTKMPVTKSLTGITSIAALAEDERDLYFKILRQADPLQYETMDSVLIDEISREVQANGITMRCDVNVEGIGAVCFPLRLGGSNQNLVLGIVGPSDRIREESLSHIRGVQRLVKEHKIDTVFKIKPNHKI